MKKEQSPLLKFILGTRTKHIMNSVPRLNYIAERNKAQTYLEIGVWKGSTFFKIEAPFKVGVDPDFKFDWQAAQNDTTHFCPIPSDDFFADLKSDGPIAQRLSENWPNDKKLLFDVIFIDGLHTFEQSLRDFENSLDFAHEDTVWVIDDTVPSSPYSAMRDMDFSLKLRQLSGFYITDWHGDVYKSVMAIHDRHPEFSYCTLMGFNPQTVLWRAERTEHKAVFATQEEIARLDYFDIFKYASLFAPVADEEFPLLLGKQINPADYDRPDTWEKLIYLHLSKAIPKEYL